MLALSWAPTYIQRYTQGQTSDDTVVCVCGGGCCTLIQPRTFAGVLQVPEILGHALSLSLTFSFVVFLRPFWESSGEPQHCISNAWAAAGCPVMPLSHMRSPLCTCFWDAAALHSICAVSITIEPYGCAATTGSVWVCMPWGKSACRAWPYGAVWVVVVLSPVTGIWSLFVLLYVYELRLISA